MDMKDMITYRGYYFSLIESPDDGGFYCEIVDKTGATIDQTDVSSKDVQALEVAMCMIDKILNKK